MKIKIERAKNGFANIVKNNALLFIPVIFLLAVGWITYWSMARISSDILRYVLLAGAAAVLVVGELLILLMIGTPLRARRIHKSLTEAGFTDKAGECPVLLSYRKESNGVFLDFYSKNISLADYEKHKEKIEAALNIKIISFSRGKDMQHVIVKAALSARDKAKKLPWRDCYMSKKDFEIVLGESDFGTESIDLSGTPHILIGGGSGSGKSKLLKLILIEAIKKGAKVFLADFKGGIDYPKVWHERCELITGQEEFDEQLSSIVSIMDERKQLLLETGTANISEYNAATGEALPRIIVACDEVAEVLDKTGLGKEEKELVGKVESKLSTIARMGRAFGVHLVLATQRPDADILKGQIKNNIGFRICGRADKVLSQIILDTPEGAEMISPEDQGMFYTNSHVLFKAYYAEDDCLESSAENR